MFHSVALPTHNRLHCVRRPILWANTIYTKDDITTRYVSASLIEGSITPDRWLGRDSTRGSHKKEDLLRTATISNGLHKARPSPVRCALERFQAPSAKIAGQTSSWFSRSNSSARYKDHAGIIDQYPGFYIA